MIEEMVFLASYAAFGGGALGGIFAQWESMGVFTYALPFLLLFALVYSILSFIPVFKDNKGVNAVIALAVALMALQFNIVSIFFADIFPRLGIALSIILVIIILGGLFFDKDNKFMKWVLLIVVLVIIIVVISGSLKTFGIGAGSGYWIRQNLATIIVIALILAAIIAVIAGNNSKMNLPNIKIPLIER